MSGGQKEPSGRRRQPPPSQGAARDVVTAAELASHYLIEPLGIGPENPCGFADPFHFGRSQLGLLF
jgi:hypothetical protein